MVHQPASRDFQEYFALSTYFFYIPIVVIEEPHDHAGE